MHIKPKLASEFVGWEIGLLEIPGPLPTRYTERLEARRLLDERKALEKRKEQLLENRRRRN